MKYYRVTFTDRQGKHGKRGYHRAYVVFAENPKEAEKCAVKANKGSKTPYIVGCQITTDKGKP